MVEGGAHAAIKIRVACAEEWDMVEAKQTKKQTNCATNEWERRITSEKVLSYMENSYRQTVHETRAEKKESRNGRRGERTHTISRVGNAVRDVGWGRCLAEVNVRFFFIPMETPSTRGSWKTMLALSDCV